MAQISRLKDAEISNGNLINADDIDTELNQLVSESNGQDTRLTALESGNLTVAGVKTFAAPPRIDQIDERTVNAGVTVDAVLHKDGALRLLPTAGYTPTSNGDFGYDSASHAYKGMVNGAPRTLMHDGNALPKGFIGGLPPLYASAGALTLPAGLKARNAANTADIEIPADLALSLAGSGPNGLDAGSEAANTWYYVYLIKKSSDGTVAGLFSTVNEAAAGSVTLPAGYDLKRQLPLAVRNDAAANLLPFLISNGWPYRPLVELIGLQSRYNGTSIVNGAYNVLAGGSAASYTAVSCSAVVPPISRVARLWYLNAQASALTFYGKIRAGSGGLGERAINLPGGVTSQTDTIDLTGAQAFEYLREAGTAPVNIDVTGFIVTEVS